jgi:hypothetical protein
LNNKFRFWDERIEFNVGGNYVRQGVNNLQNYFVPDFYVQLALTDDRKLNLKVYGRYDLDEILSSRRQMYGLGLRYRTEFGSMLETKSELKDYLNRTIVPSGGK